MTSSRRPPRRRQKAGGIGLILVAALFVSLHCAVAAITPSITSISSPVLVGDSFTVSGSGFTGGSVANFFVATVKGPVNFGPLALSGHTSTSATFAVPVSKVTTLGEGVVSVVVINTDQGFTQSNSITAQLFGDNADGFPNLTAINGVGLAATSTDPNFATDNVETVVVQNQQVMLAGNGFDTANGVAVDLFCDCPGGKIPTLFLTPGTPGLSSTALTFTLPPTAVTGPGSLVVYNRGANGDYAIKSNAVSVPVGAAVTVSSVQQSGCTVTVKGTGFAVLQTGLPPFTVINLFNQQADGLANLGGLNPKATPKIPLDIISADQFTFSLAGTGFVPGPAYVQVLNPPFVPFTSSGNTPNGLFTAQSCGPTPTPSRTAAPTATPSAIAQHGTPTPTATHTPVPTPTATPQVSLFVLNGCSGMVNRYAGDDGDIAPNKLGIFLCPNSLAFDSKGNLYVGNTNWITVYPAGSSGNIVPSATIIGPKTNLTPIEGIAVDSKDNIYALTANAILVFGAGSDGNIAPIAQITGSSTGLNLPQAIAVDSGANIYIANESGNDILVFAAGSNGNIAPSRTIRGSSTGLSGPIGVALDQQNKIYVLNSGCAPNRNFVGPSITVYPASSNGNVTPSAMIIGSKTDLGAPARIAVDSGGDMFVSALGSNLITPVILEFTAGSSGNIAPQRTISGANTGLERFVGGVAVNEKSGNIGVIADENSPAYIEQFRLGSDGDVAPDLVLGNLATEMNLPASVALDASGKIYVANTEVGGVGGGCPPIQAANHIISQGVKTGQQNSITIYAAGSSADTPPIATVSGSNTGLAFPQGVAVDATKIYVANGNGGSSGQGSITEYPINSDGNVSPSTTITGPDTGLQDPGGIALDLSGNIYVTNPFGGSSFSGSITVYAPASSGDATPIVTISGANTGLSDPQSIGLDHKGNLYVGNAGNQTITVYPASSKGNAVPSAKIGGSNSGLTPNFFGSIAVDLDGDIFASTGGFGAPVNRVLMFPSGSNGNIAPGAILAGPHTQLSGAGALVVRSP